MPQETEADRVLEMRLMAERRRLEEQRRLLREEREQFHVAPQPEPLVVRPRAPGPALHQPAGGRKPTQAKALVAVAQRPPLGPPQVARVAGPPKKVGKVPRVPMAKHLLAKK